MTAYFWIGGAGFLHTANTGNHFSLTSGGTSITGTVSLTASDDLVIDQNSGPAGFRIGVENTISLGSLNCSDAPTGMVFYDAGGLLIHGDVVLSSNVSVLTGLLFAGSVDQSIQSNGCAIKHSCTKGGTGRLTPLDELDLTNNGAWSSFGLALNGGVFDTNGQTFSVGWLTVNNSEILVTGDIAMKGKLTGSGAAPKIRSSVQGVTHSVSAGSISLAGVAFRDIDAEGAAIPWTGTGLIDEGGNANINF